MKRNLIHLLTLIFAIISLIGCEDNTTNPKPEIPESFYKKVDSNLQPTLLNLFNEIKEGKKPNIEISQEYDSELMPVDTLLRVLVAIRVNDKSVKNEMEVLNCELKNEGIVDLYYWIPIINFTKVTELEKVISIFPKGIAVTR